MLRVVLLFVDGVLADWRLLFWLLLFVGGASLFCVFVVDVCCLWFAVVALCQRGCMFVCLLIGAVCLLLRVVC